MTPQRIVPLVRTPEPPRLQEVPRFSGDGGIRTHGVFPPWRESWRSLPGGFVELADGSRGAGDRRGTVGVADFLAGTYPACSRHGAINAVGGGKWRCLVEGCNVGCEAS